jgi:hypothetical protein
MNGNLDPFVKILPMLPSDIPRETEYFLADRIGLRMNDLLTASMFCGDRTVLTLLGGFL